MLDLAGAVTAGPLQPPYSPLRIAAYVPEKVAGAVICKSREVMIIRGTVSPDHFQMLVSATAHLAPAKLA